MARKHPTKSCSLPGSLPGSRVIRLCYAAIALACTVTFGCENSQPWFGPRRAAFGFGRKAGKQTSRGRGRGRLSAMKFPTFTAFPRRPGDIFLPSFVPGMSMPQDMRSRITGTDQISAVCSVREPLIRMRQRRSSANSHKPSWTVSTLASRQMALPSAPTLRRSFPSRSRPWRQTNVFTGSRRRKLWSLMGKRCPASAVLVHGSMLPGFSIRCPNGPR